MSGKLTTAVALGLGFCLTAGIQAQDTKTPAKKLTVGDKAPDIDIAHWIKGVEMDRRGNFTPVTTFEEDKVYVLEFWATWCGPCVASMPHLSELQEKWRDYDVQIISVSDETLPKVMGFLFETHKPDGKLQNDRTQYTVCTDPDESVKNDYFRAAGRRGIPSAFIIGKDGRVEWIGHPMNMDDPLEAVVRDTWDRDAFKAEYEKARAAEEKRMAKQMELRKARSEGDWDAVLGMMDDMIQDDPKNLGLLMDKFNLLLVEMKASDRAYAFGRNLVEQSWDEPMMLNAVAWTVVDDARVARRDLDFAMRAAKRASELTEHKNWAILDTLARVHFEQGNLEQAVKWQRKSVEFAGEVNAADELEATLEKYEAALDR